MATLREPASRGQASPRSRDLWQPSPFFVLEPSTVMRDFRELREVDIDRAVSVGTFLVPLRLRGDLLFRGALGYPVFLLGVFGAIASLIAGLEARAPSRELPCGLPRLRVQHLSRQPVSEHRAAMFHRRRGVRRLARRSTRGLASSCGDGRHIPAGSGAGCARQCEVGHVLRAGRHTHAGSRVHRARSPCQLDDPGSALQRAPQSVS